jgi:parvulin-like peptidyl-prolyl isomerase
MVNGHQITRDELKQEMERSGDGQEAALERLILYRLALEDARREGIDSLPEVRKETDRIVYRAYLDRSVASNTGKLRPSDADLKTEYDKAPMVRLRHLMLFARTPAETSAAEKKLAEIQAKLKAGEEFRLLVLRYSQDESKKLGGDLDFRDPQGLPAPLYSSASKLKPLEVSAPIRTGEGIHLVQLMERRGFDALPASQREALRNRLREERENRFLEERLANLKKRARIEVFARKDTP